MKMIKRFALLLLSLALIYGGIIFFQGEQGLPMPSSNEEEVVNAVQEPKKPEPVISKEKQEVSVSFVYNDEELYKRATPLYEVIKEDDTPVKILVNGDLAKEMVEELSLPEVEKPKLSYIKATRNSLDKIIKGEPIIGVDKDKTFKALEESIKENQGNSELTVKVHTKIIDSEGGFERVKADAGFKALIASFSTLHREHMDDTNRNVNLEIASKKIDGTIVKPGERFSFNKVVGNRTKANGFKDAGVIQSGRVIPGIGGGICQVSTTLYRAVLLSGLKIIERHNHSIYDGIEYADRGLDSAVAWGYKDLIFSNNSQRPILITSSYAEGYVDVNIYAEKELDEEIILETRNEIKHPFRTIKNTNSALKAGNVKILHPGVDGYTVEAYRIIKNKDKQREELISKDRYLTYNRREEVGN
jgi:vancomycin resistance protein YoaR